MRGQERVTLTNMCMVYDEEGRVLVQQRVNTGWNGITFPGGHVEPEESFTDAVIREVYEETGLTIEPPQLCGVKQWAESGTRYVVLCYKTNRFRGTLTSSEEGEVRWVKLDEFYTLPLASGMDRMIRLFLEDGINEHYCRNENGTWLDILK